MSGYRERILDEDTLAERQMARQSKVYPNWPLITHQQLQGWYESHRAIRAERDALREEVERLRGLLAEAHAVLDYFREDSDEKYATEEGARWILRYDAIITALRAEDA